MPPIVQRAESSRQSQALANFVQTRYIGMK